MERIGGREVGKGRNMGKREGWGEEGRGGMGKDSREGKGDPANFLNHFKQCFGL